MQGQFWIVNSTNSLSNAQANLAELFEQFRWFIVQASSEKNRTQLQNKSLHLWFEWFARALNDAGLDVRTVVNQVMTRAEIPWDAGAVKELIWRPIQIAATGKRSSTSISTTQCVKVADYINKHFGQERGIYVPWPCEESRVGRQEVRKSPDVKTKLYEPQQDSCDIVSISSAKGKRK